MNNDMISASGHELQISNRGSGYDISNEAGDLLAQTFEGRDGCQTIHVCDGSLCDGETWPAYSYLDMLDRLLAL